jgi:hypothetical protein
MASAEPRWLHIGIDDEKAIKLLEKLAKNGALRNRLQKRPRQTLLSEFGIDFPGAPEEVTLPPAETIQAYVDELRKEEPFGRREYNLPHGILLLFVAHGNGTPPPPPPRNRKK